MNALGFVKGTSKIQIKPLAYNEWFETAAKYRWFFPAFLIQDLTVGLFFSAVFKKMKRRQQPSVETETMPRAVGNHGSFSSSKLKKLGILGCLYFAQGLPFGFQTKALPVYLRYHARSPPFPFFFFKVYRTRACGRVVAHARPAHDY